MRSRYFAAPYVASVGDPPPCPSSHCNSFLSEFAGDYQAVAVCQDGIDNDGDGKVDYAPGESWHDTGCTSATDTTE